jgi:predicted nucleic acid-binding protein
LKSLVIDASVSLKWVLNDEIEVEKALGLRDAFLEGKFEIVAPSLWNYEVIKGVTTAVRRKRMKAVQGAAAVSALIGFGIILADPSAEDIYKHSLTHGIAAYDAAYLALAEAMNTQVWTGDRRFYDALQRKTDRVLWIGDYKKSG